MKPPPPEVRTLAGLAADLFWIGVVGLLLFLAVDRWAPPQDLPWKPLDVRQPLGFATTLKLDRIVAERERCLRFLGEQDVAYAPVPDRTQGDFCTVEGAGVVGPQGLAFSPPSPTMTCGLTAALAVWTRQSVLPASRALLGSDVVAIDHYGTFACRRIYGRVEGRVSQHAHASAFDVAAFRLRDGRRISVLRDWKGGGPEAAFLRRVRDDGCRLFRVVLSPDYNAAHANHLHFDMSPYRLCR